MNLNKGQHGIKSPPAAPPRVLVVEEHPGLRSFLGTRVRDRFGVAATLTGTLGEAARALQEQSFDIIFYAHSNWEEGIQLYMEALTEHPAPCQFILFMDNPAELAPHFDRALRAVRKPDVDGLLFQARWPTPA